MVNTLLLTVLAFNDDLYHYQGNSYIEIPKKEFVVPKFSFFQKTKKIKPTLVVLQFKLAKRPRNIKKHIIIVKHQQIPICMSIILAGVGPTQVLTQKRGNASKLHKTINILLNSGAIVGYHDWNFESQQVSLELPLSNHKLKGISFLRNGCTRR